MLNHTWDIVVIAAGVAVLVVLGLGVVAWVRRRTIGGADGGGGTGGTGGAGGAFLLSDLRAMRDRGELTVEEYERARSRLIGKPLSPAGSKKNDPPPGNSSDNRSSDVEPPAG